MGKRKNLFSQGGDPRGKGGGEIGKRRPFTLPLKRDGKDKNTFVSPDPTTPPILGQEERDMADRGSTEDSEREFLVILSEKGAVGILRYLNTHKKGRYSDFNLKVSVCTLNMRLRQLLKFNLINHFLQREEARKEWYVITEKGRKTLECLEMLIKIQEENP